MNLGQKLWKLKNQKRIPTQSKAPERTRTWTLHTFARVMMMMMPQTVRTSQTQQSYLKLGFRALDKVGVTGQKGWPTIRNALRTSNDIQLVCRIAILFPFPHRRATYAARRRHGSLYAAIQLNVRLQYPLKMDSLQQCLIRLWHCMVESSEIFGLPSNVYKFLISLSAGKIIDSLNCLKKLIRIALENF